MQFLEFQILDAGGKSWSMQKNTSSNFWTKTARIVHSASSSKFEKA